VLGVEKGATPEQIKSAYRKLAMKHHPDKGGKIEEFQKIQEAYDALTKPQTQQADPMADHPFRDHPFAWHFSRDEFWTPPRRNSDFTVQAGITLEQAYTGCELSATINGKVITIAVPAGVVHGQRLAITGEGGTQYGDLPAGDLIVVVMIGQHPIFQPDHNDLYMAREIDVLEMLTGGEIEVETLMGERLTVQVPSCSKPSTRLRLPEKGMPKQGGGHGSLYIILNPIFPNLTEAQIEKLREIRKA
jgi:DnaJ-class molecular chaperone